MTESVWRKSSFSGNANACVELAAEPGHTAVRDSKRPEAGSLRFPSAGFAVVLRRL